MEVHVKLLERLIAGNWGRIDSLGLMRPTYRTFPIARRARIMEKYLVGFMRESADTYSADSGHPFEIHVSWDQVIPAEYFLAGFFMRLGHSDPGPQYNAFRVLKALRHQRAPDKQLVIDRNARKLIHWIHQQLVWNEMSAHELAALMGHVTHFVRVYNPPSHAAVILEAISA